MNNLIKFSNVKYTDFVELVKFLKQNDSDNEFFNIRKRLQRFFKKLTGTQAIILDNLVEKILNDDDDAEKTFDIFKINFGDLDFDPEGKQEIKEVNYSELGLQGAEMCFELAKAELEKNNFKDTSANNANLQVYYAKTLKPLIHEKPVNYKMKKALFFKNQNKNISQMKLKALEIELSEIIPENADIVLGHFLSYISNKCLNCCSHFIDNFCARVDSLYNDKNLEYAADREFLETLKSIK